MTHQGIPFNIDFGIKNERFNGNIGTVYVGEVLVEGEKVNEVDEGKGL
jgi:hypothetical protein